MYKYAKPIDREEDASKLSSLGSVSLSCSFFFVPPTYSLQYLVQLVWISALISHSGCPNTQDLLWFALYLGSSLIWH